MKLTHAPSLATKLALLFEFMNQTQIQLQVNGESHLYNDGSTVTQLLAHLGRANVPCAVEVNEQLVPKSKHALHQLRQGDRVELVTLVGGG